MKDLVNFNLRIKVDTKDTSRAANFKVKGSLKEMIIFILEGSLKEE